MTATPEWQQRLRHISKAFRAIWGRCHAKAISNVIGKVIGDKVYDADGNVIGVVDEFGNVYDLNGEPMDASVRAGEVSNAPITTVSQAASGADGGFETGEGQKLYDTMVGGKAENGTLTIQQQTVE